MLNDSSEPAAVGSPIRWGAWSGSFYTILLFFVAQLVAALLLGIYPALHHWSHQQATTWLNQAVTAQFGFLLSAELLTLGGIYLWVRHFKTGFRSLGLNRLQLRYLGYGLLALPFYYLAYVVLLGVATQFVHGLNVNQKQEIGFDSVQGTLQLLLTFLGVVIVVPLTEEIMVRGLLFGSLRKALPFVQATLLTSLLFAAAHLPEGGSSGPLWVGAIDTFTLSLFLCYLREKTGSLWPCITLHVLKNSIAFMALFILNAR